VALWWRRPPSAVVRCCGRAEPQGADAAATWRCGTPAPTTPATARYHATSYPGTPPALRPAQEVRPMNRSTRSERITVQPKRINVQRPLGVPRLLGAAALSLALVPAHGALGAVGKATAKAGQTKNVASAASSMLPTRVSFDGTLVTASNVDSFAKDPVLAFGPGVDADGHTIPGEMWLLVAK